MKNNGGAIPPNFMEIAGEAYDDDAMGTLSSALQFPNTEANTVYQRRCKEFGYRPHPARYPAALPEFFVKMLTDEGDLVFDPFAGSNVTGAVKWRFTCEGAQAIGSSMATLYPEHEANGRANVGKRLE